MSIPPIPGPIQGMLSVFQLIQTDQGLKTYLDLRPQIHAHVGYDPNKKLSSEELTNLRQKVAAVYRDGMVPLYFTLLSGKSEKEILLNTEITFANKKICALAICYKENAALRCTACQRAIYCSRKCQKEDWWLHKQVCQFKPS